MVRAPHHPPVRSEEAPALRQTKPRRLRGATLMLVALTLLGSVHALFMIGVEVVRGLRSQQEISRLSGDLAVLEEEIALLQAVLLHGDDPVYREQLARREGFIYPDEVRIVILQQ